MWRARMDEAQVRVKIARENINNLRYADDTTLMAESKEELKNLLMKEKSEKASLNINIQKTKVKTKMGIQYHHFLANRWENNVNSDRFYFLVLQNHCWWLLLQPWNQKMLSLWKKSHDKSRQDIKKQRHYFVNKGLTSQSCGFSDSQIWIWELDHKEAENQRTDVFELWLEKTLESPLDCKEIHLVHPKGNQSWIFIGRTDAEAKTPILWPPDAKNWLIWKDPDSGKDWGQEEKGATEDEVVGWHHQLYEHEFE